MATACGTTQDMEKERTLVGAVLSLFFVTKPLYRGRKGQSRRAEKNVP
jgi:hypothetical protein